MLWYRSASGRDQHVAPESLIGNFILARRRIWPHSVADKKYNQIEPVATASSDIAQASWKTSVQQSDVSSDFEHC